MGGGGEEQLNLSIVRLTRVTLWLQCALPLPCACVFAALYACAIAYWLSVAYREFLAPGQEVESAPLFPYFFPKKEKKM